MPAEQGTGAPGSSRAGSWPGSGNGVPEWMASIGAAARPPLALLEETITSVRALLRGERVELEGREVRLTGVQLVHPPTEPPPVIAGVVRPRSLELTGRVADGTLIAEGHGPQDLGSARALIQKGGAAADHSLTLFAFCSVGDDAAQVTQALRPSVEGQDYSDPGKPRLAWNDEQARAALVDALVGDALRLLGHLPEQELGEKAANAVGILALVAGQDVEPAEDSDGRDGRWRISREPVAKNPLRMCTCPQCSISTTRGARVSEGVLAEAGRPGVERRASRTSVPSSRFPPFGPTGGPPNWEDSSP